MPPVEAGDLVLWTTEKQFKGHKSLEGYNQSTSKVEYYDLCVWSIIFPRQVQASTLKGFILTLNSALIKRHTSSGLVLPETLGKCTQLRPSSVPLQTNSKTGGQIVQCSPCTLSSDGGVNQKLHCYCKQPEDGLEMIACNNRQCAIECFHKD